MAASGAVISWAPRELRYPSGIRAALLGGVVLSLAVVSPGSGAQLEWASYTVGTPAQPPLFISSRAVAVDVAAAHDATVVAGYYAREVDFDPGAGEWLLDTEIGLPDCFVSKYGADGSLAWVRQIASRVSVDPKAVAIDSDGGIIVAGDFWGPTDFDPGPEEFTLEPPPGGSSDGFVVRLDSEGVFLWAIQQSVFGYRTNALAIDGESAIWVTGRSSLPRSIVKFDSAGSLLWELSTGFQAFAVSASDSSVALAGRFAGSQDFDPGPGVENRTADGYLDAFVLSLSLAGDFQWVATAGAAGQDQAFAVTQTPDAGTIAAGSFEGQVDFDPSPGGTEWLEAVDDDVFVWSLDSGGGLAWARGIGGTWSEAATAVASDSIGRSTVIGNFRGPIDVDPGPGELLLEPTHSFDAFIVELDAHGDLSWAGQVGGQLGPGGHAVEFAHGVEVSPGGDLLVCGRFESEPADLDPTDGVLEVFSIGSSEAYVISLDTTSIFTDGFESGDTGAWPETVSVGLIESRIIVPLDAPPLGPLGRDLRPPVGATWCPCLDAVAGISGP